jgi:hypothetical protein
VRESRERAAGRVRRRTRTVGAAAVPVRAANARRGVCADAPYARPLLSSSIATPCVSRQAVRLTSASWFRKTIPPIAPHSEMCVREYERAVPLVRLHWWREAEAWDRRAISPPYTQQRCPAGGAAVTAPCESVLRVSVACA